MEPKKQRSATNSEASKSKQESTSFVCFATLLEPKLATLLEPKLATLLEPKLATLLELKLATLLEPKLATLFEPKLATLLEPKSLTHHGEGTLAQARHLSLKRGSSRSSEVLTASTTPKYHISSPRRANSRSSETTFAQASQLSLRRESFRIAQDFTLPGEPFSPRRANPRSGETILAQASQPSLRRESFSIAQDFTLPNLKKHYTSKIKNDKKRNKPNVISKDNNVGSNAKIEIKEQAHISLMASRKSNNDYEYQSWESRLSEQGVDWARVAHLVVSPERELSRLGEKWHSEAVEAVRSSLEREDPKVGGGVSELAKSSKTKPNTHQASFGSSDVASFASSDVANFGSSNVVSFGSSDVANFGSSDVASFGSSYAASFWLKRCSKLWLKGIQSPLPYAIIIKIVPEHVVVSIIRECKIVLDALDSKIDVDVIHKMGFFRDSKDMIYKHQSDQQIAPMENFSTDPPTSQPSTFHPKSSSYASISTNKMIMDELLSL
ncbi:hypothetical protein Lal_00035528 [Lupinus albus]|nr:hypothetical protein Lal_00035523 [Lupinus albus]KAF1893093.1 hypothetical protein Lal_00035528 [Lupinus albus]